MVIRYLSLISGLALISFVSFARIDSRRDTLKAAVVTDHRIRASINIASVSPRDLPVAATVTGEPDIVKYIQTLPGVATGTGGGNAFYVRGGNLGNNIQTIDGVPVYATSHLLGIASSYPLDVISTADFQLGGFSSEEGNLTASHIRMTSGDGDFGKFHAKAYVSNLLVGGHISAPLVKDRLSINASLRVSPVQFEYAALSSLVDKSFNFNLDKAAVYDAYAKLCYRIDDDRKLSLSVFHTLDSYKYLLNDKSQDSMQWSEFIADLRYEMNLWSNTRLTASASLNSFGNNQGMDKRIGQTDNSLLIKSTLKEAIIQASASSKVGRLWEFRYGVKGRFALFNPGSAQQLQSDRLLFKKSSPLVDHIMGSVLATAHAQVSFGDIQKRGVRLATRLNCHNKDGFAPEFSAQGRFEIVKGFGIEASCDFLKQYYHTLEGIPLGWSLDMLIPTTELFRPEISRQFSAGLYMALGNYSFNAGAYTKDMSNLLWFSDASRLFDSAIAGWEDHINIGSGTSKGVEVQFRKDGKVLKGQVSYTLSKTDRLFPGLNGNIPFPAKFDRRHIFNANITGVVLSDEKRELSIGAFCTYQSGHWETVPSGFWSDDNFLTGKVDIDFYTGFNNFRMPPYVRVDLTANLKLRGRRHPQELSLGVYNLLNRHNASWLSYDSIAGKWRQVSLLPIMPSLKYAIEF